MNLRNIILSAITLVFHSSLLKATVWTVGASQTYSLPSQVAALVNNGDTVNIDAGIYNSDVCAWTKNNLLLRCTNGKAHLKANSTSFGNKGIWVIQGNNTTIENIEFSLAASNGSNGAGLKQEGQNVTIRNCYFHDNEVGILTNAISQCSVRIEFTEFNNNGNGNGFTHNVYISMVDSLIFRFNYSHHCNGGAELKSRALVNYILYNRLSNEASGTGSQELDISNGGLAIVMGNIIQQGLNSSNSGIISYGIEGLSNAGPHNFYLVNNTIVNERTTGTFVSINNTTALYKSRNNIFAGAGSLLSGGASNTDTLNSRQFTLAGAGFLNSALYDYHLSTTSPALNAATNAGIASSGFPLTPTFEYVHPTSQKTRTGTQDMGAYEGGQFASIHERSATKNFNAFVSNGQLTISAQEDVNLILLVSSDGKILYTNTNALRELRIPVSQYPQGVYTLCLVEDGVYQYKKMLIP